MGRRCHPNQEGLWKSFLFFLLQWKKFSHFKTNKPLLCVCTDSTTPKTNVLGSPPSSDYYILPKRLLPEASHTLFLDACPNQFTKLSSLEPDPEIPPSLPGSLHLKARLISPAPLTIYNYRNSLCAHLITDAYYFVHKLISCIHVIIQFINYCLCWCVSVLSWNKNYQIKGHVFHLDLALKMSDARCFLKMISNTLNSTWFVKLKPPNMDESQKHYAKWEKPDTNDLIL